MTQPSEWAMREARKLVDAREVFAATFWHREPKIGLKAAALALDAVRREALRVRGAE